MAVKLKTDITFQSTKVPTCYLSKESFMQCLGNETVTKFANANTANGINNVPMQLIEQKSSAESFGANVGNCSRDFHPGTDIEDAKALFEETQETVQGTVARREPECIVGNWKFLKENINPDYIRDDLISTELIDRDDIDGGGYHDKSRQCKIDHLLTSVIRNIGSTCDLEKFINIFETDQKFIADKLKLPIEVPNWSKGVKNVEKCRHRLATNRKLVEKVLKKPQKLFDDFLENFVFDIHDHEELCNLTGGRKKLVECFMDKVLTSVEKGSYDLLLHILKTEMCNISRDYQTIVDALEKTPDQSVPEMSMCINLKSGKLYKSNEDNTPRTDASEDCTITITIKGDARCEDKIKENAMRVKTIMVQEFGVVPTHVTDGSVVIHLKSVDGNIISRLTDGIRRGQFVRLIEELFSCHEANSSIPSGHWSFDFIIELDNSSSKMKVPATPLKFVVKTGDHRLQLLHANKAFLQEEIDPLTLLEAFSKRRFDHFKEANIEIIPERKLRTDKFLDILEKESDQLMDVFIEILEDQKMNFVLRRLKLYQKMQLIDAALLKKNILKHIESIVDEVDLEDIKDEIISRCGLHGDVVEELYSQYAEGSEGRIVVMIVDILGQGDSAVCMFIDILFNSGIDSSLLEELSDIEQVSVDIDCVGDNAFVVIREVPKRGLIFQCEVEVIVEVKVGSILQPSKLEPLINIDRTQSEQLTTESAQHTTNAIIIAANRSFLIEQINTMALARAFQDKEITFFDGLDGTLRRQQRAERFLTILEEKNLVDQLLVILREQGMTYVLDRLNNCRNAYLRDPQILRRNINNCTQILHDLDIDDIREIFNEREVFSLSMFDEIEKKYSRSEYQMYAVLIKIRKSGPHAMRTLVDALYINQLHSLADSLLRGTSNELQEMKGCTQTDDPIWLERASDPLPKSVDEKFRELFEMSKYVDQKLLETSRLSDSVDMKLRELFGFSIYVDQMLRQLSGLSKSVDDPIWLKRAVDPLPKSVDMNVWKLSGFSNLHDDWIWIKRAVDPLPKSVDQKLLETSRLSDSVDQKLLETSRLSDSVDQKLLETSRFFDSVDMKTRELFGFSDCVDQKLLETRRLSDSVDQKLLETSRFFDSVDMNVWKPSGFSNYYDDRIWLNRAFDPMPKSVDQKLLETNRLFDSVDEKLWKTSTLSPLVDKKLRELSGLSKSVDQKLRQLYGLSKSVDDTSSVEELLLDSDGKKIRHNASDVLSKSVDDTSSVEEFLLDSDGKKIRHKASDVLSKSVDDTSSVEEFLLDSDGEKIRHKASDVLSKSIDDTSSVEEFLLDSDGEKIRHKESDVLSKSIDPQILRQNIFNNRTDILENLDIDDVREIFVERNVFNSSMFDEIEKKYSESEDQMNAVLIEIIKSGKRVMITLVDVLYINQLDSLADHLLRGTPNDMQEMQDNTEIVKPQSHQMSEQNSQWTF